MSAVTAVVVVVVVVAFLKRTSSEPTWSLNGVLCVYVRAPV